MLWRFIKGSVVALLAIWRLLIRVFPVTCREHCSTRAQTPLQRQNPLNIQKRNYYSRFEAQTFIMHAQLASILCTKHKEKTPWRKFALSPQHTAMALSEIWNFGTPKGTVWTQTHWEETELKPMSVFCNFLSPILFLSHNKGKRRWRGGRAEASVNLAQAQWDSAKRKWHDL